MSSRVFAPKASIQRIKKRPADRISTLGSTTPRATRSPSPALLRPPASPQPLSQKPGPTPCKNCGSTETEEGDGNIVCGTCGLVLSNAPNYTSDITFEEGSNGRIQQQGQRIADGQTHQKAFAPRGLGGGPGHEATPAGDKAKTEAAGVIRRYAMLLRVDEQEVNKGRRIFEMAYHRGFVRGRTIESVAIVSLYIATRRAKERRPQYDIMLIDLAEQSNINVFDLGKMMQDLIKKLYLNPDGTMSKDDHFFLQAHGAEVLIDKFVNHLDFGPDANKIRTDAARILQRMKRDWIHHGRRPSGVCGAAVILAARMNNYRRTLREVVLVAKVTEFTVSKRLEEFRETESSALSVSDFRDDGILSSISETDPPAYYRAQQPPKRKRKSKTKGAPLETAAELEAETDEQDDGEGPPIAKRPRLDADGFAVPEIPVRASQPSQASEETSDPNPQQNVASDAPQAQPARRGPGRLKGSKNWKAPPPTPEELAYEAELTSSMQEALDENQDLESINQLPTPSATQESTSEPSQALPLRVDPAECDPKKGPPGPAVNTNIGNTGTISLDPTISETEFDSDPEVSTCLLTETERVLKEKIWVTENAEWLRQDHEKKIRRELKDRHLREQGIDPEELRKNKKGNILKRKDGARRSGRVGDISYLKDDFHRKDGEEGGADGTATADGRRPSAAKANVMAMMKQRGTYSRRINYENLSKAYEYPVGNSLSLSRSPSIDRSVREDSVVSVSSTGTAATPGQSSRRDSIGPFFTPFKGRRNRASRSAATRNKDKGGSGGSARKSNSPRSPTAEAASAAEDEEEADRRRRTSTAVSPEPIPPSSSSPPSHQHTTAPEPASSTASPLSSTYTPDGVGTPGSPLSVNGPGPGPGSTRIDPGPSGLSNTISAPTANDSNVENGDGDQEDAYDEDEEAEDEDNDDGDDDEGDGEDGEDDDDDDGLDNAFAGTFRPNWEGEDEEVVED